MRPLALRTDSADTSDVYREDRAPLPAGVWTAEGFFLTTADVVKPGILEYRRADGSIRRELVPEEGLRDPASLATLARKPVTLEHPSGGQLVTPENVAALGVGDADGEVTVTDDGYVRVKIAVRREDALDAIRRGKQEVSPGYLCRLDETPGEHPKYGRYDAVQHDRRYNHIAITDRARGGRDIRLRADSDERITPASPTTPEGNMKNLGLILALAKAGQTDQARAQLLEAGASRADADDLIEMAEEVAEEAAEAESIEKVKAAYEAAEKAWLAEKAEYEKKIDAFVKAEPAVMAAKMDAHFAERFPLYNRAVSLKMDAAALAKMDNAALRKAVALKIAPASRTDADDSYYCAVLDLAGTIRTDASLEAFTPRPNPAGTAARQDADKGVITHNDRFNAMKDASVYAAKGK